MVNSEGLTITDTEYTYPYAGWYYHEMFTLLFSFMAVWQNETKKKHTEVQQDCYYPIIENLLS